MSSQIPNAAEKAQPVSHTSGPWRIGRYTNYIGWGIHAEGRGCIAERWYGSPQDAPYADEMTANARLIAAAPDLLAVCKRMFEDFNERPSDYHPHSQISYDMLRAALASVEAL